MNEHEHLVNLQYELDVRLRLDIHNDELFKAFTQYLITKNDAEHILDCDVEQDGIRLYDDECSWLFNSVGEASLSYAGSLFDFLHGNKLFDWTDFLQCGTWKIDYDEIKNLYNQVDNY